MISAKEAAAITWSSTLDSVSREDVEMFLNGVEAMIRTQAAQKACFVEVDMQSLSIPLRNAVIDALLGLGYKIHGYGNEKYIINWKHHTGITS
jgi:NAD(P)H-hydrate repair Nnr-like enzyme with NAD(P)H-hydrate epimerase domain